MLDPEACVFYGGDIVHFDRGLYVMFEDSDLEEYVGSVGGLRTLLEEDTYDILTASHTEPLSGEELSIVETLHEGFREMQAGEREYELVDSGWGTVRSYQIGSSEVQTKHDSSR